MSITLLLSCLANETEELNELVELLKQQQQPLPVQNLREQ